MAKAIIEFVRMVSHGIDSISLTEKRDYWEHVPGTPEEEAGKRWQALGERFRNSMNKVVAGSGKL